MSDTTNDTNDTNDTTGGGGGEWPSTETPPTEPAPGADPQRAAAIEERREANVAETPGRTAKEAVEENPVLGATGAIARDDRPAE